jgi:thiol:disulfide interchange protein DsbC
MAESELPGRPSGPTPAFFQDPSMPRSVFFAAFAALSLSACAAEPGNAATARVAAPAKPAATAPAKPAAAKPGIGDDVIRAAVAKAIPGVKIDQIKPSSIPGYREVSISGRVVYVSLDGQYLLQGSLIRLADRTNLTDASEAVLRKSVLASANRDRRIVFPAANPRYRVTVFTDIDCGFCRKLHSEMAGLNAAGITVEYLFFPRAGINSDSYDKAVSVWCARDQRKALTDAKAERPVPEKTCANPIAADFELGRRVGVDGTPAIYLDDGTQIGGYLAPKEMLEKLQAHAAEKGTAAKLAGQ